MVMTIEKDRCISPVHLHVDDATPVHVHVKKPKKSAAGSAVVTKTKASAYGSSNLRRSTATSPGTAPRSKSPGAGPWVPPPGKASKGVKYHWQGGSHRLEINNPEDAERIQNTLALNIDEVSTDEEDNMHGNMRQYEKKIDGLMSEVGTLKNEVDLQRTLRHIEAKDDELDSSRREIRAKELQLEDVRRELRLTEAENSILRRSRSPERRSLSPTGGRHVSFPSSCGRTATEALMKKLVEVEMDGQACVKQIASLKETMRRLKEERKLSSNEHSAMAKQKGLLMERMSDFDTTNRQLRKILQDRHEEEMCNLRLQEQRDLLLKKLAENEDIAQKLKNELLERDRELTDIRLQSDAQKDENMAISGLQTSLESNRAHLQKQLRQKEGDCNRMAVQIRRLEGELEKYMGQIDTFKEMRDGEIHSQTARVAELKDNNEDLRHELSIELKNHKAMETQLAQERIEVDHLTELLKAAKDKAERDKEALKKATRAQKQRATRSEDALESLNVQIMERDNFITELRADLESTRSNVEKLNKEKIQSCTENSALNTRINDLEAVMARMDDGSKKEIEETSHKLHEKSTEATTLRLENERLKTSIANIEDKLSSAETEVNQLRAGLKQYETLVDEYRQSMNRSRREADETMVALETEKREKERISREGEQELDKVKGRLQTRLAELEPIPELLKTTELKLHDATEKLLSYERRNTDNTKLIAELTAKVENQSDHLDNVKEKLDSVRNEHVGVATHAEVLTRKCHELEEQNRDLLQNCAKREEAIHQLNLRLDEKNHEGQSLSRQLESALHDSRKLAETTRDKISAKDRSNQTRILDLESQLSAMRAENARIKREKEEAERKANSRVYDLKDRLEQSHSTNRSMQNYVQFLKSSYANVFGDSSALGGAGGVGASVSPSRTMFPYS